MNKQLQALSKEFFDAKAANSPAPIIESLFARYYKSFYPSAYSAAMEVVRDADLATRCVNDVFLKMYNTTTFVFDNTKSHLSYVCTMAHRKAQVAMKSKNRSKEFLESDFAPDGDGEDAIEDTLNYLLYNQKDNYPEIEDFTEANDPKLLHNNQSTKLQRILTIIDKLPEPNRSIVAQVFGIEKNKDGELEVQEQSPYYAKLLEPYNINTTGAIKTKMFRARKIIREELSKEMRFTMLMDGIITDGDMVNYFDNSSQMKSRFSVLNNKLHGEFTIWYENGKVRTTGTYVDGKLDSSYTEYYDNQKNSMKINGRYENGIKDGLWIEYFENGSVSEKLEFMEGEPFYYEEYEGNKLVRSGILDEN